MNKGFKHTNPSSTTVTHKESYTPSVEIAIAQSHNLIDFFYEMQVIQAVINQISSIIQNISFYKNDIMDNFDKFNALAQVLVEYCEDLQNTLDIAEDIPFSIKSSLECSENYFKKLIP